MAILPGFRSAPQDEAIVLALGGNLAGDYSSVQALLEAALYAFPHAGLRVVRRSGWWRSAAWPDPSQPAYLNGVAIVETALAPQGVMGAIRDVESQFGRVRTAPNASRTLDLDLVAYGRSVIHTPELTVPHPRAAERLFVMGPLAEIAPAWRHPVTGESAAALAAAATVARDAHPVATG